MGSPLLKFLLAHSMGSPLWLLFGWSWNFYKCQIFDGVSPVVTIWLVMKFLQVSDFRCGPPCWFFSLPVRWGPPCGCHFVGREIFTSVRHSCYRRTAFPCHGFGILVRLRYTCCGPRQKCMRGFLRTFYVVGNTGVIFTHLYSFFIRLGFYDIVMELAGKENSPDFNCLPIPLKLKS